MEFAKYPSLENAYREKYVNACRNLGIREWVATEKLDGSNFMMASDGHDLMVASRNQVIPLSPEGIYEFQGCTLVVNRYASDVIQLAKHIGATVYVYGELYGQGIQRRINYGDKDFAAFDIMTEDGTFLPWDEMATLCAAFELPIVPELRRGSIENLLTMSPEFNSYLSSDRAEGFTIKPVSSQARLPTGSRPVIKSKSQAFSEIKPKRSKQPTTLGAVEAQALEDFTGYLTENRLHNVLSKETAIKQSDFGRITGLLIQDALTEFTRDAYLIDKDTWKVIKKPVGAEASKVIRAQWLNILDSFTNEVPA
jgi:Rnl2 family RNA ligase